MRIIITACLLFVIVGTAVSQSTGRYRGSIPEDLLRPSRSELPCYPEDTVIGKLGQGSSSDAAFSFATWVAGGLLSGRMNHPALESINPLIRESYLQTLATIEPRIYRIGGGREEPDGSTSFLIRFVGKEQAITAEMYIRHVTMRNVESDTVPGLGTSQEDSGVVAEAEAEEGQGQEAEVDATIDAKESALTETFTSSWILEDFIADEARSREQEERLSANRLDYVPYERFY